MTKRRFVILDRDGTIIFERDYLSHPDQVEMIPGAVEGLRSLIDAGLGLIVVTNQSGISRGFFDETRLSTIHERMCQLLNAEGVKLDAILHCPHRPEDDCECRKPKPGLVWKAAQQLAFEPNQCFVIGDKPCDTELGTAISATTFLVRTGYGDKYALSPDVTCDHVVDDIQQAAVIIKNIVSQGPTFQSSADFRSKSHLGEIMGIRKGACNS